MPGQDKSSKRELYAEIEYLQTEAEAEEHRTREKSKEVHMFMQMMYACLMYIVC